MIKNDKIITCNWSRDGGVFEYDISYLHSDLGVFVQEYRISSMTYEGKRIYQSDFSLFAPNSEIPGRFSHLPKEIKDGLLDVVFAIKLKFFNEYKPDIVEHFIDGAYTLENRFELYRSRLMPLDYDIKLEKTKRTITYQKKETSTGNSGGFLFY